MVLASYGPWRSPMRPDQVATFVATRLKVLREARGLSLRRLAHRSDITPEMLSRAERCERLPSIETLARVCVGLEMSLAEFFDEGDIPTASAQTPGPSFDSLAPTAREHFLDAIRSIERGVNVVASPVERPHRGRRRRPRAPP